MTAGDKPDVGKRSPVARAAWGLVGLISVAIGGVGIVVPGLPTTVFFVIAAWAFSKSSPRLEAWVLGLPRIGPMVADYRAGLGMPRRAKITAIAMIGLFSSLSIWLLDSWILRLIVLGVALAGVAFIGLRIPTREHVLAEQN